MVHSPSCPNHNNEYNVCECGINKACYSCGYGEGNIPCKCTPLPKIEYVYIDWQKRYNEAKYGILNSLRHLTSQR